MLLAEAINRAATTLNENDLLVLNYIKKNKGPCAEMTITDLSKACAVSTSFIMRLTKKLGYSGFSELKYQLKQESQLPISDPLTIVTTIKNDLAETFRLMETTFFSELPALLHQANTIYTYGSGYAQQTILEDFRRGMIQCNKFVVSLPTSKEVHLNAQYLRADDVVIIVSMSGHVPNIENDIREMTANHIRVISITKFQANPLAALASDCLYLQSTDIPAADSKNNYTSYTTLTLLLDTIVKCYLYYQRQLKL